MPRSAVSWRSWVSGSSTERPRRWRTSSSPISRELFSGSIHLVAYVLAAVVDLRGLSPPHRAGGAARDRDDPAGFESVGHRDRTAVRHPGRGLRDLRGPR